MGIPKLDQLISHWHGLMLLPRWEVSSRPLGPSPLHPIPSGTHLLFDGDSLLGVMQRNVDATGRWQPDPTATCQAGANLDRIVSHLEEEMLHLQRTLQLRVSVYFDGSSGVEKEQCTLHRRRVAQTRALHMGGLCPYLPKVKPKERHVPLLKQACKAMLRRLGIAVHQCWGEADSELAHAAWTLMGGWEEDGGDGNCHVVVSQDSDFYCQSCPFMMHHEPFCPGCVSAAEDRPELFVRTVFIGPTLAQLFDLDPELVPLFASLMTNDYVSQREVLPWYQRYLPPGRAYSAADVTAARMGPVVACPHFYDKAKGHRAGCEAAPADTLSGMLGAALQRLRQSGPLQGMDLQTRGGLRQAADWVVDQCEEAGEREDQPVAGGFRSRMHLSVLAFAPWAWEEHPDATTLPELLRERYCRGEMCCDFSDMLLRSHREWWDHPCPEDPLSEPLASHWALTRRRIYGLAYDPRELVQEHLRQCGPPTLQVVMPFEFAAFGIKLSVACSLGDTDAKLRGRVLARGARGKYVQVAGGGAGLRWELQPQSSRELEFAVCDQGGRWVVVQVLRAVDSAETQLVVARSAHHHGRPPSAHHLRWESPVVRRENAGKPLPEQCPWVRNKGLRITLQGVESYGARKEVPARTSRAGADRDWALEDLWGSNRAAEAERAALALELLGLSMYPTDEVVDPAPVDDLASSAYVRRQPEAAVRAPLLVPLSEARERWPDFGRLFDNAPRDRQLRYAATWRAARATGWCPQWLCARLEKLADKGYFRQCAPLPDPFNLLLARVKQGWYPAQGVFELLAVSDAAQGGAARLPAHFEARCWSEGPQRLSPGVLLEKLLFERDGDSGWQLPPEAALDHRHRDQLAKAVQCVQLHGPLCTRPWPFLHARQVVTARSTVAAAVALSGAACLFPEQATPRRPANNPLRRVYFARPSEDARWPFEIDWHPGVLALQWVDSDAPPEKKHCVGRRVLALNANSPAARKRGRPWTRVDLDTEAGHCPLDAFTIPQIDYDLRRVGESLLSRATEVALELAPSRSGGVGETFEDIDGDQVSFVRMHNVLWFRPTPEAPLEKVQRIEYKAANTLSVQCPGKVTWTLELPAFRDGPSGSRLVGAAVLRRLQELCGSEVPHGIALTEPVLPSWLQDAAARGVSRKSLANLVIEGIVEPSDFAELTDRQATQLGLSLPAISQLREQAHELARSGPPALGVLPESLPPAPDAAVEDLSLPAEARITQTLREFAAERRGGGALLLHSLLPMERHHALRAADAHGLCCKEVITGAGHAAVKVWLDRAREPEHPGEQAQAVSVADMRALWPPPAPESGGPDVPPPAAAGTPPQPPSSDARWKCISRQPRAPLDAFGRWSIVLVIAHMCCALPPGSVLPQDVDLLLLALLAGPCDVVALMEQQCAAAHGKGFARRASAWGSAAVSSRFTQLSSALQRAAYHALQVCEVCGIRIDTEAVARIDCPRLCRVWHLGLALATGCDNGSQVGEKPDPTGNAGRLQYVLARQWRSADPSGSPVLRAAAACLPPALLRHVAEGWGWLQRCGLAPPQSPRLLGDGTGSRRFHRFIDAKRRRAWGKHI